ncbi:MAG: hypothetical protein WCO35_02350 [Candidatus Nomurabacteria bacterium]
METNSLSIYPLRRQLSILERVFRLDINPALELSSKIELSNIGNIFAVPKRSVLIKSYFSEIKEEKANKELVDLICSETDKIDRQKYFTSYTSNIGVSFIGGKTKRCLEEIEKSQKGSIILIKTKILNSEGLSSIEANQKLKKDEFALDPYSLACIMLVNNFMNISGKKLIASGGYVKKDIYEEKKEVISFNHRTNKNNKDAELFISTYSIEPNLADEEFYHPIGFIL